MSAAGKLFFKTDLTDELHFGVQTKAIGYVPCYKLAAFNGFQFYDKCFRRLAYNIKLNDVLMLFSDCYRIVRIGSMANLRKVRRERLIY